MGKNTLNHIITKRNLLHTFFMALGISLKITTFIYHLNSLTIALFMEKNPLEQQRSAFGYQ